jgi:flagellar protein FlbD
MFSATPADNNLWNPPMIYLTRLNSASMVLNSDLIEHIDITPDTVITLTTGQILRVREPADEVIQRIVEFRRRIFDQQASPPIYSESAGAGHA